MNIRSYHQFCALASALDVVGERWNLLIIRELLAGPRRFKDLMAGLPGISSNLLSERLKNMEQHGLLCRRVLPPPAGSSVYALTPLGLALEKAVLELGKWGSQFLPASLEGVALPSLGAIALAIKAFFHPEQAHGVAENYELHLDNEILQVQVKDGALQVKQGRSRKPDVVFHTEMQYFVGLFAGQIEPAEAIAQGLIRIERDRNEDDGIEDDEIEDDEIEDDEIEDDEIEDDEIEDDLGALRRFLNISGVPKSQ